MSASITPSHKVFLSAGKASARNGTEPARRGRPWLASPDAVLQRIRRLADRGDGLYRIHQRYPDLYARARRQFGSWAAAVAAAGVNYEKALADARRRSLVTRRRLLLRRRA